MSLTLLALLIANPQAATDQPIRMRMCADSARAAVQLAYKPYGNGVYGSDGVTCRTTKPGDADEPRSRGKYRIEEDKKAKPR